MTRTHEDTGFDSFDEFLFSNCLPLYVFDLRMARTMPLTVAFPFVAFPFVEFPCVVIAFVSFASICHIYMPICLPLIGPYVLH